MTTIDRYLLQHYAKVLIVLFISFSGLYVIVDFCNNFDEFLSYGKRQSGGIAGVIAIYYGPRMLQLFDQLAGLLAMLSAMFVITVISRSNELTALMAAGIGPARVLKPLLFASLFVAVLGVANREFGLPQVRDSLSHNAQDLGGRPAANALPDTTFALTY